MAVVVPDAAVLTAERQALCPSAVSRGSAFSRMLVYDSQRPAAMARALVKQAGMVMHRRRHIEEAALVGVLRVTQPYHFQCGAILDRCWCPPHCMWCATSSRDGTKRVPAYTIVNRNLPVPLSSDLGGPGWHPPLVLPEQAEIPSCYIKTIGGIAPQDLPWVDGERWSLEVNAGRLPPPMNAPGAQIPPCADCGNVDCTC